MFKSATLAALAATASAHMCALSPMQRGGIAGADQPGASACANAGIPGPCGPAPAGAPVAAWIPRQEGWVHTLKNLNHFNAQAPGNFSAFLWDADGKSIFLGSTADRNDNGAVYTIHHVVPGALRFQLGTCADLRPAFFFFFCAARRTPLLAPAGESCPVFLLTPPLPNSSAADAPEGNYVLQTIYSPNNAAAPPSFFQCADVQVLHPNTTNFAHKHAGY